MNLGGQKAQSLILENQVNMYTTQRAEKSLLVPTLNLILKIWKDLQI